MQIKKSLKNIIHFQKTKNLKNYKELNFSASVYKSQMDQLSNFNILANQCTFSALNSVLNSTLEQIIFSELNKAKTINVKHSLITYKQELNHNLRFKFLKIKYKYASNNIEHILYKYLKQLFNKNASSYYLICSQDLLSYIADKIDITKWDSIFTGDSIKPICYINIKNFKVIIFLNFKQSEPFKFILGYLDKRDSHKFKIKYEFDEDIRQTEDNNIFSLTVKYKFLNLKLKNIKIIKLCA